MTLENLQETPTVDKGKVLLVDNEPDLADLVREGLEYFGFEGLTFTNYQNNNIRTDCEGNKWRKRNQIGMIKPIPVQSVKINSLITILHTIMRII